MDSGELKVTVKFNYEISLWQAIKLRIAGKNLLPIVEEILKTLSSKNKSG